MKYLIALTVGLSVAGIMLLIQMLFNSTPASVSDLITQSIALVLGPGLLILYIAYVREQDIKPQRR